MNFRKLSMMLATMCGMFFSDGVASEAESDIIFKLDFEKGLTPIIAKGDPSPRFLGQKNQLKFEDGLCGGKAMVTGSPGQAVRFKAKGNIDEKQGTICFWVKGFPGAKWNLLDRKYHVFFRWKGKEDIMLFKFSLNYFTRLGVVGLENKKIHQFPPYKEDEWNMFAFTWNKNKLNWFLNGRHIGFSAMPTPFSPPDARWTYFEIGQAWGKGETNRVTDELTIYKRALAKSEIFALYSKGLGAPTNSSLWIPYSRNKITINGKIDHEEWDIAATALIALDTVSRSTVPTISRLHLVRDKDWLYFLFQAPTPQIDAARAQEKLLHGIFKQTIENHDENVDFDDALEFRIVPDDSYSYRLVVNSADVKYDYRILRKTAELKWDPKWFTRSSVSMDGWLCEGKIAFADLGGAPKEGATWQANFYRIWKKLRTRVDAWNNSNHTNWMQNGNYSTGKVTFPGHEAVSVCVKDLRKLNDRELDSTLLVSNTGTAPQRIRVMVKNETGSALIPSRELKIPPGKTLPVPLNQRFESAQNRIKIIVDSPDGKQCYWKCDLLVFKVRSEKLEMHAMPVAGKLIFSGDFSGTELKPDSTQVEIELKKNGENAVSKKFKLKGCTFRTILPVKELPNGKYNITVRVLNGTELVTSKQFTHEKRTLPEWLGNKLGIPAGNPPPPWTPLEKCGDTIKVWNREYDYGQGLFPQRIAALDMDLLVAPISLKIGEGGPLNKATVSDVTTSPLETNFTRTAQNTDFEVKVAARIEFDGLIWHEMTVTPLRSDVSLDKLTLEIPLKAASATLMMPHDYTLSQTGNIRNWHNALRPVWVGNEKYGLCFFAEHSHNWNTPDRKRQLEIVVGQKAVVLRVNMIAAKTKLDKSLKIEFGLLATPIKPMPKDRRKWRFSTRIRNSFTPEKDAILVEIPGRNWNEKSGYDACYPVPRKNHETFCSTRFGLPWHFLPYYQLARLWEASPEFKDFGAEWSADLRIVPSSRKEIDLRHQRVCPAARSYQDFLLDALNKLETKQRVPGYYFDVSQPEACYGTCHGCGFVDANGSLKSTFNIMGTRQLLKRIYTQLKQNNPNGIIAFHASGQLFLPVLSFADVILDGENFRSTLLRNRGYQQKLKPDVFRAEYMGKNFGIPVVLLPEFRVDSQPELKSYFTTHKATPRQQLLLRELASHHNYLIGMTLLHDSCLWRAWMPMREPLDKYYRILDTIGYASRPYKFMPYWDQTVARISPEKICASFYTDSSQVVAVVMNFSDKPESVKLSLNLDKLNLKRITSVCNLEYDEPVAIEGNTIVLQRLPQNEYRVLLIK